MASASQDRPDPAGDSPDRTAPAAATEDRSATDRSDADLAATDLAATDLAAADRSDAARSDAARSDAARSDADRADADLAATDRADADLAGRLLDAAVRLMPAARRDWGHAMQAELAAIDARPDRWGFARGCLRAAAAQFHLLRGAVHLLVVLGVLATLLVWAGTEDDQTLAWVLYVLVSTLAGVSWAARRVGMLGPTGDSRTAWLARGGGYLAAGAIAAAGVAHLHPAGAQAADSGAAVLGLSAVAAGFLLGPATVLARRSAATARVLIHGFGSGLGAAAAWVITALVVPPIPDTIGWALALTGAAVIAAVLANSRTTEGALLAGLLATTTTLALIFVGVTLLAGFGPDAIIPNITPAALPADRVAESRIEIVDPYVAVLVLSGLAASALGLAAVLTRRPAPRTR